MGGGELRGPATDERRRIAQRVPQIVVGQGPGALETGESGGPHGGTPVAPEITQRGKIATVACQGGSSSALLPPDGVVLSHLPPILAALPKPAGADSGS